MPGDAIRIDRLTLELPAESAATGRRVALLVAAGLAAAGALPAAGDIPSICIELTVDGNADAPLLARQIVDATVRRLGALP
jgi:hypothetical protein